MNKFNPKVDEYFANLNKWQAELKKLRMIILDCGLTEELKWRVPIYTDANKNIVGINRLKESCAISFFKGALLKDAKNILIQPGENTKSGRWVKFTNRQDILEIEPILKAYIIEAVEVEKAGLKVPVIEPSDLIYPEEFQQKLDDNPALKTAFDALTSGRQRHYILHFSGAKQSKTRTARVEKSMPQILNGKGLNDR
ncbi:MAG: hypothetical protein HON98_09640 [Chloroflexi bacterium]|jgi:uncharacterized protein YdeI (YjbR/CyaY-like superfamily)|nr:hypothetical protein [Chloroflexota bacterium]MBT3668794.1 hypothetical protein [Chloroflexota bacterium]MBT4003825.1 hypothetical protein [Chloroflexota bacterium]MBT4306508.1 hypothetical protein [Chloroflexota bacterium]MBT4533892.1 hypothetical protein [Chloroflexota bacterium]